MQVLAVYKRMSAPSFLTAKLWNSLSAAAETGTGYVAIAYIGKEAPEVLPLREGSTLVCDASEAAVKAGQTHPGAVLKYLNGGVRVFSVAGLHAKAAAFPRVGFVGSMNASRNSQDRLKEAGLCTRDPATLKEIRRWVEGLAVDEIWPSQAKALLKLYRPPNFVAGTPRKKHKGLKETLPLWLVLIDRDASEAANETHRKCKGTAQEKIIDRKRFGLDWFEWEGRLPATLSKPGGWIVQIHSAGRGGYRIYEPERVLQAVPVKKGGSSIIHLEYHRREMSITLSRLRADSPILAGMVQSAIDSECKLLRRAADIEKVKALFR